MKIYVVAHENIIIPEEYSKVEIEKEEVVSYIKKSVAYQDMLEIWRRLLVTLQWMKRNTRVTL